LNAHPRHLVPARSRLPHPQQIELFLANLAKEFGTYTRVSTTDDVPCAVADYIASQNLPSDIAMAPHPELRAIPWFNRPMLQLREGRAQAPDLVSVQHGYVGIAETGTLMLPASAGRPTTLNLLPDTEIVVLRASRIVGPFEDAWDILRNEREGMVASNFLPRNVMFVTGPSRSADIESTLELGAHGPRRLHVVLVDDDITAR
jgi:L-lactate dehydrogenase complex protein LldG